jgi:hypothetical protein
VRHLEAAQLVEKGKLVAEELQQFMRITNALSCGHEVCVNSLVQGLETLVALGGPDFLKTKVDRVVLIGLLVGVSLLNFRETVNGLKSCVHPAGSTLITKSKCRHLIS